MDPGLLTLFRDAGNDGTAGTDLCLQAALGTTSHFHHETEIDLSPKSMSPNRKSAGDELDPNIG